MPETQEYRQYCEDCGCYEVHEIDHGPGRNSRGLRYETFGRHCDDCGDNWRCDDCNGDYSFTCGNCAEYRDDSGDDRVYSYDYRPCFNPKGDPAQVMMGVELEVGGSGYDVAEAVAGIDPTEDHLYLKEDSSIDGVEIVTHPMTLAYARSYPFDRMLRELRYHGSYVDSSYGLHVHVDRLAFRQRPVKLENRRPWEPETKSSATHQMMWLLFLYRNGEQLKKLARRSSHRWASFDKPDPGQLARNAKAEKSGARYLAVNCQNEETFELRFFQSTLEEREFYAALEFADASVRYTRSLTTRDVLRGKALEWSAFSAWIARENYPHLCAEISK